MRTTLISKVTGLDSANDTARRHGIYGTDLGIMWDDAAGRTFVLFGDTYGQGWCGNGAGPREADWRCNVLAVSTNRDLDNGLRLDSVFARPDGHARQVIDRDPRVDEETIIPCSGVSIGDAHYVHYMSVHKWGSQGRWSTNYSGIAVSADGGETWAKPAGARWINRAERDHPFQMGAFALGEDYLYLLGTPNGRWAGASLARVGKSDVLDTRAYDYWNGYGWYPRDEFRAVPVMRGNVAELSVIYSTHLGRWLAIHLDEALGALVLRSAEALTGPWSDANVLVTSRDYPGLYGGFIHPASARGSALYFAMSLWPSYNVYLMRTDLP